MANMTKKELERQETLNEAWRVFADAMNYSDDALICYSALVKTLYGTVSLNEFQDRDILLANVDKAISTLMPKEQEIVFMRYGLNGNGPMSRTDMATHYNVTRERIRQQEVKILRKLRHPIRAHYIISKERARHQEVLKLAEKRKNAIKQLKQDTAIEYVDMSVRTYNCLKRAGIDTMGQLVELSYDDLIRIKNMGKHHIEEVFQIKANFLNKDAAN